jgi:hypothetical protein
MLLSVAVLAGLTAWLSSNIRQWDQREEANESQVLQQFIGSFTTGNLELVAEPSIIEDRTVLKWSQNGFGISEYRIVAPIKKHGSELWAVWHYVCDENYPGSVSKFGYAEAATRDALPPVPFPLTEHLKEPTYAIVDGEPQLNVQAQIVDAPTYAKAGDTIKVVAKTDRFMQCDLVVSPVQAISLPPRTTTAPESGVVSWSVKLNPTFRGSRVDYSFQARTNALYRAKTVGGTIKLGR